MKPPPLPNAVLLGCVLVWGVAGCNHLTTTNSAKYETVPTSPQSQPLKAKAAYKKGLWNLSRDEYAEAEMHFQRALVADVNFGPAHNGLGIVYLNMHRLYLAAWEFEFAAKLMPNRAEPILNTAMTYELARRYEQALGYYEAAYDQFPDHPDAIGGLARILVKRDDDPDRIRLMLQEVIFHDDRPDWICWAEELLETQYGMSAPCMEDQEQWPMSGEERPSSIEQLPKPRPLPIELKPPTDQTPVGDVREASPMTLGRHPINQAQPWHPDQSIQQVNYFEPLGPPTTQGRQNPAPSDIPQNISWSDILSQEASP